MTNENGYCISDDGETLPIVSLGWELEHGLIPFGPDDLTGPEETLPVELDWETALRITSRGPDFEATDEDRMLRAVEKLAVSAHLISKALYDLTNRENGGK